MIANMTGLFAILGMTVLFLAVGAGIVWLWIIRKANTEPARIDVHSVAERVRATGLLVGLEVAAKEIATATKGWGWLPPIVLSQAKLAMIFQFEKQYSVNLGSLCVDDVKKSAPGCFELTLPPLDGRLRLVDVLPYDIQAGRVLGLLDVIPMSAERQSELMKSAQEQAGKLLASSEEAYQKQARASIEKQLRSLLGLFDMELKIAWCQGEARESAMDVSEDLQPEVVTKPKLTLVAG